ncbi:hypothetical protein NEHOM01_0614 [Nematocida homosporus]|uniref:uncharacterized protein n=1 Tax=Nematocida homosporus TaxID=1912981 RepID=UPI0022211685|nr:uncharacterized protein NEHOM01_0614 [Nematocida homosporus]KAI5185109.1 hypothetical protein NEHOM01_0614 [Nematocida homosporus]
MEDIEYQLRFLLDSATLTVDRIHLHDPSRLEPLQFLKKYKSQKIIPAFIQEQKSGHITAPLFGVPIDPAQTHHKLLYCHLAIGNPLFTSQEYALNCKPPKGYDSFLVTQTSTNIEEVISEFKRSKSLSNYSYIVPDRSRVLIIGEVEFTYDSRLEEKSRNNDTCEFCQIKTSISFCLAERASFCADCDMKFHDNSFTQRHVRYYFNQVGKKRFLHCRDHSAVVVDYFCTECKIPVCTQCRIFGAHAEAPNNRHRLISYIEACDYLKLALLEETEPVERAQSRAQQSISALEKEISGFEKNVEAVRARLDYEYKSAISVLSDLIKRRYQKINAKFLEGKYLEKMAQHAKQYPQEVDPSVLVGNWKSIETVNQGLSEMPLPVWEEEAGLVVQGSLSVVLDRTVPSPTTLRATYDDELSRQRTEMLLKVGQFKSRE